MRKLSYFIRYIVRGIKNMIRWAPIIFNDRNYDHTFLYKIIAFKTKEMAQFHKDYGIAQNHLNTAKELEMTSNLSHKLSLEKDDFSPFNNRRHEHRKKLFDLMERKIDGWWD